jgi:type I restriction enzyme, S subunit
MTFDTLFEKFDQFADLPNAMAEMRELVLLLSVRGKLSAQSATESCMSQLAEAFAFAKRKGKTLESEPSDVPFSIPGNWGWVAVGHSMNLVNGTAFKPEDWTPEGTPIVRIQNLNNENLPFNRFNGVIDPKFYIRSGDVLISWSGTPGTSFGAFIWNGGLAILNQHIFRCELVDGVFLKEYLRLAVNARLDEMISRAHGGVGLRHITKGKLESILLPLPPLPEQKRIVAKVDELTALCHRLGDLHRQREIQHVALSHASLAHFAEAPTPKNLDFIFHKSYAIRPADLRKCILTLAVQGKLMAQDPSDEPVEALLMRSLDERRKLKRTEALEVELLSAEDALGYDIPQSWRWQYLEDLLVFGPTNGFSPKAVEFETPVRSLTLSATTSGRFKGEHSKFITTEVPADSDLWLSDGDILVQRGNTIEYVGVAAVYRGEPMRFIYPDLMMKLRLSAAFDVRYVHLAMSQEASRDFLRTRASGTSGSMPKINQTTLKRLPIPVPPLAEQRRIVTKVDQLMALVDELETYLASAHTTAEKLMEAIVVQLTSRE